MSTDGLRLDEAFTMDPVVSDLEAARAERDGAPDRREELHRQLATERSAGKALLVTVLELESRLHAERDTARSLGAEVEQLQTTLADEQREHQTQRVEVQRLWGEIRLVEEELREAERPLWKKLLRRA